MTREQAKRWLKEIEWWANGGDLWFYDFNKERWMKWNIRDLDFNSKDPTLYVIEDQHFETRKAWALGKPIEYRRKDSCGKWTTLIPGKSYLSWSDTYEYRLKPTPWYRNIPEQGILCHVWNTWQWKDRFHIITEYIEDAETPFHTNTGTYWQYAKPATKEEIEQYLWKGGTNET